MAKETKAQSGKLKAVRLTSIRGERISAVEGLRLTPRMRAVLDMSKDKSGEERRALIKAQFTAKPR